MSSLQQLFALFAIIVPAIASEFAATGCTCKTIEDTNTAKYFRIAGAFNNFSAYETKCIDPLVRNMIITLTASALIAVSIAIATIAIIGWKLHRKVYYYVKSEYGYILAYTKGAPKLPQAILKNARLDNGSISISKYELYYEGPRIQGKIEVYTQEQYKSLTTPHMHHMAFHNPASTKLTTSNMTPVYGVPSRS